MGPSSPSVPRWPDRPAILAAGMEVKVEGRMQGEILVADEIESEDGDIEIEFTGLRPAEKLYEELLIGENVSGTDHQRIMRAEEKANKLPTKMTLATMALTVPPLLIILVGPSVHGITQLGNMGGP